MWVASGKTIVAQVARLPTDPDRLACHKLTVGEILADFAPRFLPQNSTSLYLSIDAFRLSTLRTRYRATPYGLRSN